MSEHKRNNGVFHHAFRIAFPGIVGVLATDVFIGLPSAAGQAGGPPSFKKFLGVWDTGATHSVITSRVVQALGLFPCGKVLVRGVNSQRLSDQYLVDFGFMMGLAIPNAMVTENDLSDPGTDVLVGMDIIHLGDFSVANGNGKTIFTFAIPPFPTPVDLLEKANCVNPKRA